MSTIAETLRGIDASSFKNAQERMEAVAEAHALISRIEPGWGTTARMVMTYPTQMAAVKIVGDLGLFQKWIETNDGGALSTEELSGLVECDPVLFKRLLRHLAATNVLWIDKQGLCKMTPFAISLVKENAMSAVDFFFNLGMPVPLHLPTFFKDIKYQNPDGKQYDCFRHLKNMSAWEYLGANPAVAANLGQFMQASTFMRGNFVDVYPCETLSGNKDEVLIVDVGGSIGHDLQAFKKKYPSATGRLVLQDLPDVIENAKKNTDLDASIEKEAYDFFTPQPVKGARIYLFRTVLHDWADADARRILEIVKPALKKGHSKVILNEVVVPTTQPDAMTTTRDLNMMYMNSGVERTEEQWKALIESAGFKVTKIWRNPLYAEAAIELDIA